MCTSSPAWIISVLVLEKNWAVHHREFLGVDKNKFPSISQSLQSFKVKLGMRKMYQ